MKFPRGVSHERLLRLLSGHGYVIVRQKGSHIRLQHIDLAVHSITVPKHDPIKIGTLRAILAEVADRRAISLESLIAEL